MKKSKYHSFLNLAEAVFQKKAVRDYHVSALTVPLPEAFLALWAQPPAQKLAPLPETFVAQATQLPTKKRRRKLAADATKSASAPTVADVIKAHAQMKG